MKKALKLLWQLKYLLLGIALFCALDAAVTAWAPIENCTRFGNNDYEKTVLSHGGETVYDRVMCGSSTAVNGYVERLSRSGFVNCGLVYCTAVDVKEMLEKGYLGVREELVINMADLFFYDELDTNPTYPWHRGALEPYVYFQRDRISKALGPAAESLVTTGALFTEEAPPLDGKYVVWGKMSPEELEGSVQRHSEIFWPGLEQHHEKNLEALEWICVWCRENSVRLRTFWSPWNPTIPIPDSVRGVMDEVEALLGKYGVECVDFSDAMPEECFYDVGHLNQDVGAVKFTEVLDEWLMS